MSDSTLKSGGARYVAKVMGCCKSLREIHLQNCEIKDFGA